MASSEEKLIFDWTVFAKKLGSVGYAIFEKASVKITEKGFADEKILGLTLLARTMSNLKAALLLLAEKRIVEARTITRCCFENQYWVVGLIEEGEKFSSRMFHDEMSRRKSRSEMMFSLDIQLDEKIETQLREFLKEMKLEHKGSKTLNPKEVASIGALKNTYIFYGQLSSDSAHPSVDALNRYIIPNSKTDVGGIDVEPAVKPNEIIDTLNLLSLAVISVCVGVNQLLYAERGGHDLTSIADEYSRLTKVGKSN